MSAGFCASSSLAASLPSAASACSPSAACRTRVPRISFPGWRSRTAWAFGLDLLAVGASDSFSLSLELRVLFRLNSVEDGVRTGVEDNQDSGEDSVEDSACSCNSGEDWTSRTAWTSSLSLLAAVPSDSSPSPLSTSLRDLFELGEECVCPAGPDAGTTSWGVGL